MEKKDAVRELYHELHLPIQNVSSLRPSKRLRPTDVIDGFEVCPGLYDQPGAVPVHGGVSFTIVSQGAESCTLVLYERKAKTPFAMLKIPEKFRIGRVYSMIVFGLDIYAFEYCYRMDGPYDPEKGLLFDKDKDLLDPYAKAVTGQRNWGEVKRSGYRARVVENNSYMWKDGVFLKTPMEDSIIYEMHVRGFTIHPSSNVMYPGTFAGIIEKIPYLKDLGVTAVELLPVFEFDEMIAPRKYKNRRLIDYWGYNTVAYFAPNTSYAASAEYNEEGNEFRKMVRILNDNGIEVILDVVFNHTAEGDSSGPVISFKGIDNNVYYLLDEEGNYLNYSGCGNTVSCNNTVVQTFIIECLRYWVTQYHISGFRFDLASILSRGTNGLPMQDPPLLERIANDPILSDVKLIAEAWDAGGMYQVGSFPAHKRWAEWNGKYRDAIRGYLKGDIWNAPEAAKRIIGSPDLYHGAYKGYTASINFITCHDGFTLYDLYSYNEKHNLENGWNNTDGSNDNRSWNCGVEGETNDLHVLALRRQLMRNAIVTLMMSRGTPMILAGDEFANTQDGNNNTYCQDNELSWLNWEDREHNDTFFDFYRNVIRLRKNHPAVARKLAPALCGLRDCTLSNADPDDHVITDQSGTLCVLFAGNREDTGEDDVIYLAINAHWEETVVRLPALPSGFGWGVIVDTAQPEDHCFYENPRFLKQPLYAMTYRSVAVFTVVPLKPITTGELN